MNKLRKDLFTVKQDGQCWRWVRYAIPCGIYTSEEGFISEEAATATAQRIAPLLGGIYVAQLSQALGGYVPFQQTKGAYADVQFEQDREDWVGA